MKYERPKRLAETIDNVFAVLSDLGYAPPNGLMVLPDEAEAIFNIPAYDGPEEKMRVSIEIGKATKMLSASEIFLMENVIAVECSEVPPELKSIPMDDQTTAISVTHLDLITGLGTMATQTYRIVAGKPERIGEILFSEIDGEGKGGHGMMQIIFKVRRGDRNIEVKTFGAHIAGLGEMGRPKMPDPFEGLDLDIPQL